MYAHRVPLLMGIPIFGQQQAYALGAARDHESSECQFMDDSGAHLSNCNACTFAFSGSSGLASDHVVAVRHALPANSFQNGNRQRPMSQIVNSFRYPMIFRKFHQ